MTRPPADDRNWILLRRLHRKPRHRPARGHPVLRRGTPL